MISLLLVAVATAQTTVTVGFYNVENFFDTVPNPMKDDGDFTPEGRYRWDTERYRAKLTNLARVVDAMNLDILALAEVESLTALDDLVRTAKSDYCRIHFNSCDPRGIDLAILYKGDKFFPDPDPRNARLIQSGAGREFLYVRGLLAGWRVDLIAVHLPSASNPAARREKAAAALRAFADSLSRNDPGARPVILGDFNADASHVMIPGLTDALEDAVRRGEGSYIYDGRRMMYDNILLDSRLAVGEGKGRVFVREWMLSQGGNVPKGWPLRTFARGAYMPGFSDHLPVWCPLKF